MAETKSVKTLFSLCLSFVSSNNFIEHCLRGKDIPFPISREILNNASALGLSLLEDFADAAGIDTDFFWEKHYKRLSPFCTQKWQFLNLNLKPDSKGFHKKLYFQTLCLRLVTLLNMEGLVYGTARESWQEFVLQMLTFVPEAGRPCFTSICQEIQPDLTLLPRSIELIATNVTKIIFCPSSLTRIQRELVDFLPVLKSLRRVEALGVKDAHSMLLLGEFINFHMQKVHEVQFRFCRFESRKAFQKLLKTISAKGSINHDNPKVNVTCLEKRNVLIDDAELQQQSHSGSGLHETNAFEQPAVIVKDANPCTSMEQNKVEEIDLFDAALSRDEARRSDDLSINIPVEDADSTEISCMPMEFYQKPLTNVSGFCLPSSSTGLPIQSIEFITCSFSQDVFALFCTELLLMYKLEKLVITGLLFNILPLCRALNKLVTMGGNLKFLKLQDCFIDRVSLELVCMISQPYIQGKKSSSYLRSLSLIGCDLESSSLQVVSQCVISPWLRSGASVENVKPGASPVQFVNRSRIINLDRFRDSKDCDSQDTHEAVTAQTPNDSEMQDVSYSIGKGLPSCPIEERDVWHQDMNRTAHSSGSTDKDQSGCGPSCINFEPKREDRTDSNSTGNCHVYESRGLRELNLSQNCLKDDGIRCLTQAVAVNDTLEILNISHTDVSWQGLDELLACLSEHPALRKLVLSGNIYDKSTSALSNLISKNRLTYLDLSCCCLEGFSDDLLSCFEQNNSLETLILAGNRLGDSQVLRFCRALENSTALTSLANLDLSDNLLHVDSMKVLANILCLRKRKFWRLQLSGNSFNMKMLDRLGILHKFKAVCRNIDIRGLLTEQGMTDYVSEM